MGSVRRLSLTTKLLLAFWSFPLAALALLGTYWLSLDPTARDAARCAEATAVVLALAFTASIFVIRVLTRSFSRSIRTMIEAAEDIGKGGWERRIDFYPGRELELLASSINWMAERIGEHIETITEQKEKLQAVLDGMWDGVMVLDRSGRIQSVNRSLRGIVSAPDGMTGKRPLEVVGSPELQDLCDRIVSNGGKGLHSVMVELHDRTWEVNIIRAADSAQGLGLILVFHDISERKRAEAMRRDFAANVSHELRTPLTSVKGYAETLLSDPPPPPETAEKFLRIVLKNADHMSKMVNDLLSLSRLEAREQRFQVGPVNPRVALKAALEGVESLARAKGVEVRDELDGELEGEKTGPPRVFADQGQLSQVFRNLLENAIKFGPDKGMVHVTVAAREGFAEFQVRDLGPGIPKRDQPRIFERFYSVEKYRSNKYGSTGLGLAICRHIVRNMGGDISVQSPPPGFDTGTAFTFTVPISRGPSDSA